MGLNDKALETAEKIAERLKLNKTTVADLMSHGWICQTYRSADGDSHVISFHKNISAKDDLDVTT